MSNLKYLKGVRTRYFNALNKEVDTAAYLLAKDDTEISSRELLSSVSVCAEKLQTLVNKLETQSEKVAAAISGSEEDITEEILAQDSKICDCAWDSISKLKQLENELSDLIKREDVESVSEDAENTKESIQIDMKRLFEMQLDLQKEFVKHTTDIAKEVNSVKLPKLEISSFNGDKLRWLEFWQSFETSVHKSTNLSKIDKFNYLRSKLTDKARGAITGLALTCENYEVAIAVLKERFGDTQEIIDLHYNKIVNLKPVSDSVESLRYFLDTVEKNLRSLEVLGQDVTQEIFVSLIKSKLPMNVVRHLEIKKGMHVKWTVERLREALTEYIVASEKAEKVKKDNVTPRLNKVNDVSRAHAKSSTEALVTNTKDSAKKDKSIQCRSYSKSHWSDECSEYKTIQERKSCLKGACYRCLKKGHRSSECKSDKGCIYCNQMNVHHRSLCPKRFSEIKSIRESVNTVDEISENCIPFQQVEEKALLSSNEIVLMQTARTRVKCPTDKREKEIRLLLILTHGTNIQKTKVFTTIDESIPINPNLEEFWKIESIGIYDNPCDSDDEIAMKNFRDTVIFKDNRYHVTWPWISDIQIYRVIAS